MTKTNAKQPFPFKKDKCQHLPSMISDRKT